MRCAFSALPRSGLEAFRFLVAQCAFLRGSSRAGMTDRPLEFFQCAQPEPDRVPGLDVGAVPMRAVANRGDGRLGRTDQLRDLGIGQLGMALQQKGNRIRLVLPLGYRRVARSLVLDELR